MKKWSQKDLKEISDEALIMDLLIERKKLLKPTSPLSLRLDRCIRDIQDAITQKERKAKCDSGDIAATYITVWNGGEFVIETACRVNADTHEIVDVTPSQTANDLIECLDFVDEEYVVVKGIKYQACEKNQLQEGDKKDSYWWT